MVARLDPGRPLLKIEDQPFLIIQDGQREVVARFVGIVFHGSFSGRRPNEVAERKAL